MRELKLPMMADVFVQDKWLSMGEYIEFINFISMHFIKAKKSKKDEVKMRVNAPFFII